MLYSAELGVKTSHLSYLTTEADVSSLSLSLSLPDMFNELQLKDE